VARAVGLDASHAMLAGAFAARHGPAGRTHAGVALAEALPLATASIDAVTSFNAVHHFAIDGFVREAGRILCPGGLLVIYTRTPEQNGRTVWGEHFPGFADRETRLPTREILRAALAGAGAFARVRLRTCAWWQFTTLATLLDQARARHYSTFCFYDPDEFEAALADFRTGVRRRFISPRDIPVRNNHVVALARRRRARGWPGRRLARALVVRLRRRLGA
jgi:SAM-dependent methyltransferase